MIVRIADHVVSLDIDNMRDGTIRVLCAPFEDRSGAQVEAWFSIPEEEVAIKYPSVPSSLMDGFTFMHIASCFCEWLLSQGAFSLHSSAIEYNGLAYMFTADSGVGKSTHTRLWREAFGPEVRIINDDKPVIARKDGVWTAYGAPWSGKGPGANVSAPIGGICQIIRDERDSVKRVSGLEAFAVVFSQTPRPYCACDMGHLMKTIDSLIEEVPIYELRCGMTLDAALTARDGICSDAGEGERT